MCLAKGKCKFASNVYSSIIINKLKKAISILFLLIGLQVSYGQELDGVWMSYNSRRINNELDSGGNGFRGLLLDFKRSELGFYQTDTVIPININFKRQKIRYKSGKGKLRYKAYGKDSIEVDFYKNDNTITVFRPLNLNFKISMTESQITDFLVKNRFQQNEIEFDFTNEMDFFEQMKERPKTKKKKLKTSLNNYSYWFLMEKEENIFLIFKIGEYGEENIYQIRNVSAKGISLKPLQEDYYLNRMTEFKTCL